MAYKKTTVEFDTDILMDCLRDKAKGSDSPSLRDIENVTGVSASTLSRIDNGNMPDMETFMKLIQYLKYVPQCFVFIEWTGEPIPENRKSGLYYSGGHYSNE